MPSFSFMSQAQCSMLLLPMLFFHVVHIRRLILQSAFMYVIGQILRTPESHKMQSRLELVSGTNLMKIEIAPRKLSMERKMLRCTPAQPIYLNINNESSTMAAITTKLFINPFTITSLPKKRFQHCSHR